MWNFGIIIVLFGVIYAPIYWGSGPVLRRHIGPGFVVAYALIVLAAFTAPSSPYFFAMIIATFLATVRDRVDACCRFVMFTALVPNIHWHMNIGPLYLCDLDTLDLLAICLYLAARIKPGRNAPSVPRGLTLEDGVVGALMLIFWIGANRFQGASSFLRSGTEEALLLILPYFVLRRSIRTSQEFMEVVSCLAVAAAILGFMAIYESHEGWILFDMANKRLADAGYVTKSIFLRGGAVRASVSMNGPLMLAFFFVFGSTAVLYARGQVRSTAILVAWTLLIVFGLIKAQSRGNLAMLVLAALIFCVLRRKWGFAALIGIGAPMALGLLFAIAHSSPAIADFLHVNQKPDAGASGEYYDYRGLLLARGLQEAAKHRWTGSSLNDALGRLSDITQGQHIVDLVNTYLVVYLVSGMAGLCLLVAPLVLTIRKLLRRMRNISLQPLLDLRSFTLTMMLVLILQLAFMSFIDRIPVYLMFVLVGARIVGVERRRLMRQGAAAAKEAPPASAKAPAPRKLARA